MNSKDLKYFLAIYESKSINSVARKLFITPQGLSKTLQSLERELEVDLFIRTTNGLSIFS